MNAPFWQSLVGCAVFAVSTFSNAALVSYDLDQSNMLPDGPAYLRVTIDDEGIAGRINFRLPVLGPLVQAANRNVGIDEFGFNSAVALSAAPIVGLPIGWNYTGDETVGGFGRFEASVEAKSPSARVKSLSFSITSLGMDTISSYLDKSSGHARDGNFFFAARVVGLDRHGPEDGDREYNRQNGGHAGNDRHGDYHQYAADHHDGADDRRHRHDDADDRREGFYGKDNHREDDHGRVAYFAGSTPHAVSSVPSPESAWLLLSGAVVFACAMRRRRAADDAAFAFRDVRARMPV